MQYAQPAIQQLQQGAAPALHEAGREAGAGAREGIGGLDTRTVAAVGVGAVLLLGIVGFAAFKSGKGGLNNYAGLSESQARAYDELMKRNKSELVRSAAHLGVKPPRGYSLGQASKDDLSRGIAKSAASRFGIAIT